MIASWSILGALGLFKVQLTILVILGLQDGPVNTLDIDQLADIGDQQH
jgi:hypothetical protein